MPFDVAGARKAGYSPAEIADFLSKDKKFDASGARKAGYSDAEIINHLTGGDFSAILGETTITAENALDKQSSTFGKAMEVLSAPNYMMAQGASAALKGEPILPAMKRGLTLQEPKVFGDVIAENMPFAFTDPTTSAAIQTVGGLVGDIALDPLTYAGAIGKASKAIPGVKQGLRTAKEVGKKIAQTQLAQDVGSLFSRSVGPGVHREAQEVLRKYETLQHYRSGKAVEEMAALDKKITKIAKKTGEDPHALRMRIVDSVEKRMMSENPTINEIVESIRVRNAEQLAKERALDLPTGEVSMLKFKEDEAVMSGVDYFVHVLTPESKKWLNKHGGKEFRGISKKMTDKHASMLRRKFGEMSVDDVNNYMRTQGFSGDFFMTDVARAQATRDVRHARAITGAEFYDEMANRFGKKAGEEGTEGFVKATPERLKDYVFPPEVADVIGAHHKEFVNPKNVNRILATYDTVQNWWKSWTLGIFPAYHARNMAGNVWNNFLSGMVDPRPYKMAMAMQRGGKGTLKTVLGDLSYEDVARMASERGVLGGKGFYGGDIPSAIDDALVKGKWLSASRDSKILRGGMKVGKAVEENARLAHFIDKLQKGMDADSAARSVKKFLFDYTELTDFEKNVMKRIFPFYSWSRKNLPLQMEMFLRKPGRQIIPVKLKHEIERLSAGEKPPPDVNVTDFLRGDYAFRVSGRDSEGNFKYVPIAGYLPWGDIPRFANDPLSAAAFMVSPLIKEPIQQATNYDLYFRRPIANKELPQAEAKTLWSIPLEGQEFQRFLGIRMSPRAVHVLRNIRLLASVHRANHFQVFGESTMGQEELGTGQKIAQYVLGVRNYEVNDIKSMIRGIYGEKRKLTELQKEIKVLGNELARARKSENPEHLKDVQDRIKIIN